MINEFGMLLVELIKLVLGLFVVAVAIPTIVILGMIKLSKDRLK